MAGMAAICSVYCRLRFEVCLAALEGACLYGARCMQLARRSA